MLNNLKCYFKLQHFNNKNCTKFVLEWKIAKVIAFRCKVKADTYLYFIIYILFVVWQIFQVWWLTTEKFSSFHKFCIL